MSSMGGAGGGVSRIDPRKGHGYITPHDGGREVYFQCSAVKGGAIPRVGQRVEFVLDSQSVSDQQGLSAGNGARAVERARRERKP